MGCRISVKQKLSQAPTVYSGKFFRRKIASLFADLHLLRDRENGADFVLRYYIYIKHNFCVLFLIKSAPSRLSPIEALPQTPQGTLSLDPASPLTPGLSLRFISRSARCCLLLHIWAQLCSALPIPHSSLLIPHFPLCILLLNPTKLIELISVFTKMRKIILNLLTFLYGCGIV